MNSSCCVVTVWSSCVGSAASLFESRLSFALNMVLIGRPNISLVKGVEFSCVNKKKIRHRTHVLILPHSCLFYMFSTIRCFPCLAKKFCLYLLFSWFKNQMLLALDLVYFSSFSECFYSFGWSISYASFVCCNNFLKFVLEPSCTKSILD